MKPIVFIVALLIISCKRREENHIGFHKVSAKKSLLEFNNTITETETFNILDYEYLYNGGGVGVGDFNMDGLSDLVFTGNMVSSRIYINQGDLQFKDVTESSGLTTGNWCTGVSIVDINNDGKPDIYISTAHDQNFDPSPNYFFINQTVPDGPVKFQEMSEVMGLNDSTYAVQAVWMDYDKDMDLDLFVINNSIEKTRPRNAVYGQKKDGYGVSTDILYRNDGLSPEGIPRFINVSREAGILTEGWSLGVIVNDFNNDSYPDIYIGNDFLSNDLLYINNLDGTFTNEIEKYFKHQSHNSMGLDAADINNDGHNDLIVLDMLPEDNLRHKTMFGEIPFQRFRESTRKGYQPQYLRNVVQVSNKNGSFNDIGYYANLSATDWSWSPLLADFNNDGYRDAYITNGYKKDITDKDFIDYNNSMNAFGSQEKRRSLLIEQLEKMKGIKKSNFFFENMGDHQFSDTTKDIGLQFSSYSNGAVYADLDTDGDLDLVTNNINEEAFLFENKLNSNSIVKANFLRLAMIPDYTTIGAKIWLYNNHQVQYAEFHPQRGYLSSVEPVVHFGLDTIQIIDSLKIIWPNQKAYVAKNISVNQELKVSPTKHINEVNHKSNKALKEAYFKEDRQYTSSFGYFHKENGFDDFKKWPLHFRSYSKPGPLLLKGDINNDSLEDVFIGGTANHYGTFFMQDEKGLFTAHRLKDSLGMQSEDSAAALFDVDGDGDLDLYCASGSIEHYSKPEFYQHRLYVNDGRGHFTLGTENLPEIRSAVGSITPLDFDNDGDLDVFVGSRITPDKYPMTPRSYLLENKEGVFIDVTLEKAQDMAYPGMVTDSYTTDLNNDGWIDLVLVGEWMPVKIYYNQKGNLRLDKSENGLSYSNGWWNCINAADFDQDGDIDFVAGNWGLNNPFSASKDEPLSLYAKDYDENGTLEAIMTKFNQGKEYIIHPRGTLVKQLPYISRVAKDYKTYGELQFEELFDKKTLKENEILKVYELASVYIENLGDGKFSFKKLPHVAQWSPIFDFEINDIDSDEFPDLLAVGNYHDTEVLTGHYDAGDGWCLINKNNGIFEPVDPGVSGFKVPGEARNIIKINQKSGKELFIVGLQNDSLKIFKKTYPKLVR